MTLEDGLRGFLSAAAAGRLGDVPQEMAYDVVGRASSDPGRVAVALGLVGPGEASQVGRDSISEPLLSAYHDALVKTTLGPIDIGMDEARQSWGSVADSVSRACHVSPGEFFRAASAACSGDTSGFDRMMADYYS